MRLCLRWVIRIGLGLLAVVGILLAGLFVYSPGGTVILLALLIQPLVSNTNPPPIAEDQLAVANWRRDDASRNLTTLLQEKFPAGSSEAALISTLSSQGFKLIPAESNRQDCLEQYAPRVDPDDNTIRLRCEAHDPGKAYKYSWAGGICGSSIIVGWTTDGRGNLIKVMAAYRSVCL